MKKSSFYKSIVDIVDKFKFEFLGVQNIDLYNMDESQFIRSVKNIVVEKGMESDMNEHQSHKINKKIIGKDETSGVSIEIEEVEIVGENFEMKGLKIYLWMKEESEMSGVVDSISKFMTSLREEV